MTESPLLDLILHIGCFYHFIAQFKLLPFTSVCSKVFNIHNRKQSLFRLHRKNTCREQNPKLLSLLSSLCLMTHMQECIHNTFDSCCYSFIFIFEHAPEANRLNCFHYFSKS